nr:GTP-binding protein [Planctomycetales bacterium]
GRLDLTQAEAVWGVVQATDEAQLDVALRQLAGGLSTPLVRLRDQLLHLVAHLEAGLDFVDEEIEFIAPAELRQQLQAAAEEVSQLVAQMRGRSEVPTAPRVVLTGAANVGKSSLFNALLEKQGALVSQRAGTTRDYLTATLELDGATCQLVDTAGFAELAGEPTDAIASQSQAAAAGQLRAADVELLCRELSHGPPTPPTKPLPPGVTPPRIIVLTKRDLGPPIPAEGLNREGLLPVVAVSSHTGEGLDELRQVLRTVIQQTRRSDDVYVSATVTRCQEALRRAATYLEAARSAAAAGTGEEIVAAEIRQALDELGEVVGAVYTDDILDRIFSRFCIGK